MSVYAFGTSIGIALAFAILMFGFWGFLLACVLGALGAIIAGAVAGRIDLRAAVDAARGRRVA